ncbi:enoyl-CoA delta isomerase 1, mitochondrial-like [Anticarsia gemmatalis]|uniref:enoyl-CoA delta isomerase 1, mitochondrial-like n=1 Tax=Anticarsia gemmatalis TaxID=129554 RepID=UPI003F765DE9
MFPIRQIVNNVRRVAPGFRAMSSSGPLTAVEVDSEGIATVTMQRPPVNSLNLELLQELSNAFDYVEKNKCKGMVLASASPRVFSAGLDIWEMYEPDLKRAEVFITALQDMWLKLYGSSYVTAAAINGHAPAGGCILGLSCEYRVMVTGTYTIGLNESALGLTVPQWLIGTLVNTIPPRQAELALTNGTMFTVEEAVKVGLIDETASDKADSVDKCKKFIKKFDRIPPLARAITKQKIRQGPLAWMKENYQANAQDFLTNLQNKIIQQSLGDYIKMMKNKSKK